MPDSGAVTLSTAALVTAAMVCSAAPSVPASLKRNPDGNATAEVSTHGLGHSAITDGLSKKQAIALLVKNSPKAQKIYRDEGSMPAYNYVEMIVKAAQQQSAVGQVRLKSKGLGQ